MRQPGWVLCGLALCLLAQPGHALAVVCKSVPAAAYDPSITPPPPPGSAASVPADLDPKRDDWAKGDVPVAVERDLPGFSASAAPEATVAEATVNPQTGSVRVNGQPLPSSPADVPKHVIVCHAASVDK